MRVIILAGGRGTRLRSLTAGLPKPLIPILGRPVLQHQIDSLRASGLREITIVVGHLGSRIREHFGDGRNLGVDLHYVQEDSPLGTAGALAQIREQLPDRFLVLYGDLVLDMDFTRLIAFHERHAGGCTAVVHPNDHPYDSDLVSVNRGAIRRLIGKRDPRGDADGNLVNAGVYLLEPRMLAHLRPGTAHDLERDMLAPAVQRGEAFAYRTPEYIKDMGTPERLALVTRHLADGVVARRNLRHPQRAVFLDRDGTINDHVGLVSRSDQLRVADDVHRAIRMINDSGRLAIVVTNQSVVARGLCTPDGLSDIHRRLESMLGQRGAFVDDILACPHHPDRGYPEENPAYKVDCDCRKPNATLVDRAVDAYHIDRRESWIIGDSTTDVETGRRAGLRTILIGTGLAGRDGRYAVTPDASVARLSDAVELALTAGAARVHG